MTNAITVPQLQITGVTMQIVPNSLQLICGFGTYNVKAQSAGGGVVDPVYFKDVAEAVSFLTFKIYCTDSNIQELETIIANSPNNTLLITMPGSNFTKTIASSSVVNDPQYMLGVDAEIEVQMKGAQAV